MVGNRIAKPELIRKCIETSNKVMLLFNYYQDPRNTFQGEYDVVVDFKHSMQDLCDCAYCHDKANLSALSSERLDAQQQR